MRHRKENYVVGFGGEGQCVYGRDKKDEKFVDSKVADYIQPMTRGEAENQARELTDCAPTKRYVFKLVSVKSL